jgi:hypothetical protein
MQHLFVLGGLAFDPAIKGMLVVAVGATILIGSIYLIVSTNTGVRLGLLIVLGSLFGWMSILTSYWWISPPGNGPRGTDPTWVPVEIYVHEKGGDQGPPKTEVLSKLPDPSTLPTAAQVISDHPELLEQLTAKPENTTLSDIAGIDGVNKDGTHVYGPNILKQYYGLGSADVAVTVNGPENNPDALNGWRVVTTSNAGDAGATVDAQLVAQKYFKDSTQYKRLNAFEWNEDQTVQEACPDAEFDPTGAHNLVPADVLCRVKFRVAHTFNLFHSARYQVIQIQPVVQQTAQPGQPPPLPKVDTSQPVISVLLVRDQGNVRAKPAYFFLICFSLFLVFVLMLHYRDKTEQKHLVEAEALRTGKAIVKAPGKE